MHSTPPRGSGGATEAGGSHVCPQLVRVVEAGIVGSRSRRHQRSHQRLLPALPSVGPTAMLTQRHVRGHRALAPLRRHACGRRLSLQRSLQKLLRRAIRPRPPAPRLAANCLRVTRKMNVQRHSRQHGLRIAAPASPLATGEPIHSPWLAPVGRASGALPRLCHASRARNA